MLSESLQNQETTVNYADRLIRRSIRFFEEMKETPGTKILEAKVAIREGRFSVIPLSETQKNANSEPSTVDSECDK